MPNLLGSEFKEKMRAATEDSMPKASQSEDATIRQLGGTTTLPPAVGVYAFDRPGPAAAAVGGLPTGKVELYQNPGVFVHESFFGMLQRGMTSNRYQTPLDPAFRTMTAITPTKEWYALLLALMDQEAQFGQTKLGDVYSPPGGYPNGRWVVNGDSGGGIGPFQISTKRDRIYNAAEMQDTEANVHAGINEFWNYGNYGIGDKGGASEPYGLKHSVEWTLLAYNAGPGNAQRGNDPNSYRRKVIQERYPWYLQQLNNTFQGGGVPTTAAAGSGPVSDVGQKIIDNNIKAPKPDVWRWQGERTGNEPGYSCVFTARRNLHLVFGNGPVLVPRGFGGAKQIGQEMRSRAKAGRLPAGWREVPPGSPNGIGFYGSGAYGHIFLMVGGKVYDQWSARDGGGKPVRKNANFFFQMVHSSWDGSTAQGPVVAEGPPPPVSSYNGPHDVIHFNTGLAR